jgi:hypothetical protein
MRQPCSLPVATLMLVALATAAAAQDGPVSGKEIQETWVGKELLGTTANGAKVVMKLEANGKAALTAGNTSDTGTWRVADQGYCTTWATIRAGAERCFTVARAGGQFKVFNPDGSLSGSFHSIK